MASNVKLNGTSGNVYVQSQAVAHVTDTDLEITMGTRPISDKSSGGFDEIGEGPISASGSGTAWMNPSSSLTGDDLGDFVLNRTKVSMVIGKTSTAGDPYWNFQGYITSWNISYPLEDTVSYTFSYQSTGTITKLAVT